MRVSVSRRTRRINLVDLAPRAPRDRLFSSFCRYLRSMALPTLDPSMSRADILSVRRRVSDYDLEKSVDKAKLYILATRWLLESPVSRVISASQGEEADIDTKIMQSELDKAVDWLRINESSLSGSSSSRHYADMRNFREDHCGR